MSAPTVVISEFMDAAAVDALRRQFAVHYDPALADRQQDLPALLEGARALVVRNRTQFTAGLLERAPVLECVGRLGVGLDNIDTRACAARGIAVYPASGANNRSVAEYVVASAMMLMRRAFMSGEDMRAGRWPREACAGREINGKVLGLIGFGAIARDTARLAGALGMEIIAHDPFVADDDPAWSDVRPAAFEAVLAAADVLSLHVPLSRDTRHLIGAAELARMKPDAVLVNAARGGVLDEAALVAALRRGRLGGAALDVFETEPLDAAAARLFDGVPNLVLSPHVAGITAESNARVSAMIADRVAAHLGRGV